MSSHISQSRTPQIELFAQPPATRAETHRLFFALMPNETTCREIGAAAKLVQQQHADLRARWVKPERYHATLNFLGDYPAVPEDIVEKAKLAGDQLRASSFTWTLDYAASFRGHEPPCVLRGTVVPEALLLLWRDLNAALVHAGLHRYVERQFTPHVTLAYGRRELPAAAPVAPITWQIDEVALIHNIVGKGEYQRLGSWPLSTPAT
jgi:2'-5' RNA ligase